MEQQIAISGLGGQGVLFITRLLAETALSMGLDVISSETHGMAMRGGAVISYLKIGNFESPLIRAGMADIAIFLADENLKVHPDIIGPKTRVFVNSDNPGAYEGLDASSVAEEILGRRQASNLVLLGYALGKNALFASMDQVGPVIAKLSKNDGIHEMNKKALAAGLEKTG